MTEKKEKKNKKTISKKEEKNVIYTRKFGSEKCNTLIRTREQFWNDSIHNFAIYGFEARKREQDKEE